jgi:hypothetical protein
MKAPARQMQTPVQAVRLCTGLIKPTRRAGYVLVICNNAFDSFLDTLMIVIL